MDRTIISAFGDRIRVRANGVCIRDSKLLLVGHRGLIDGNLYWCPPGGGVNFGESARHAVVREFAEETGLRAKAGRFMFFKEYIHPPLHAVELYFLTEIPNDGVVIAGFDPELAKNRQSITEVRFVAFDELQGIPAHTLDPVFHGIDSLEYLCDENEWPAIQKRLI